MDMGGRAVGVWPLSRGPFFVFLDLSYSGKMIFGYPQLCVWAFFTSTGLLQHLARGFKIIPIDGMRVLLRVVEHPTV